jgi:acyl transferase domain-containing protein
MCIIEPTVSGLRARRAAELRRRARAGSAVDALVVAIAEPGQTVLTGDRAAIEALAAHADAVAVEVV